MIEKGFNFREAERTHLPPPPPPGRVLVARYWLPLEVCLRTNEMNAGWQANKWAPIKKLSEAKKRALGLMRLQHALQAERLAPHKLPLAPVNGKPLVRVWRFSSVEPDARAGWDKIPIDRLLTTEVSEKTGKLRRVGLGVLTEDKSSHIDSTIGWSRAKRGHGAVLLEVWSAEVVPKSSRKRRAA